MSPGWRRCLGGIAFPLAIAFIFPAWLLADELADKRHSLRQAMERGIFTLYEVPLETYLRLEMWDEIGQIFESNNNIAKSADIPGPYCSRPYPVDDRIWVFENAADGAVYQFCPYTLKLLAKIENAEFAAYEGGIRHIAQGVIIAGGSGAAKDVDGLVLWDTLSEAVTTLKLVEGHYVCAINLKDETLYVGSCGEIIGAWDFDALTYRQTYHTGTDKIEDWNEKECLTAITTIGDKLYGVGEKTIFIWDLASGELLKTHPKILSASMDYIHQERLYAYRGDRCVVQNLDTGRLIAELTLENPIEDLIITANRVIDNQDGEVMIISLRRGKGFRIYDVRNLALLRQLDVKGHSLASFQNAIFSTDDRKLYRYEVLSASPEAYNRFLEQIDPEKLNLDETAYQRLMVHLAPFPEIVQKTGIARKFMETSGLSVKHKFKYLKIGAPLDDSLKAGTPPSEWGYQLSYEVANTSEHYYCISLVCAWSGAYGKQEQHGGDSYQAAYQSFFIGPGQKQTGEIVVGVKEPLRLVFYPADLRQVTQDYMQQFMRAISPDNKQVALIDRYLQDDLVKNWHELLRQRKAELAEKKTGFWLFNLFR